MSPSAIQRDPPSPPSAASTRWKTRGSSSSKSRDALNSRLMECSSLRRSTSWRRASSVGDGGLRVSGISQGEGGSIRQGGARDTPTLDLSCPAPEHLAGTLAILQGFGVHLTGAIRSSSSSTDNSTASASLPVTLRTWAFCSGVKLIRNCSFESDIFVSPEKLARCGAYGDDKL